jgi:hypothetical protein
MKKIILTVFGVLNISCTSNETVLPLEGFVHFKPGMYISNQGVLNNFIYLNPNNSITVNIESGGDSPIIFSVTNYNETINNINFSNSGVQYCINKTTINTEINLTKDNTYNLGWFKLE